MQLKFLLMIATAAEIQSYRGQTMDERLLCHAAMLNWAMSRDGDCCVIR
jgi:hypothetical protein